MPPPRLVILLVAGASNFVMIYILLSIKFKVQVQVPKEPNNFVIISNHGSLEEHLRMKAMPWLDKVLHYIKVQYSRARYGTVRYGGLLAKY